MVRGLLVVLALTAGAARAQENPEGARSPGATAPPEEGAGKVVLASRSPAPKRDAGSGAADGGVGGGAAVVKATEDPTAGQLADCSVSEALLSGQAPAVRYYPAPVPPVNDQDGEWDQAPYVRAVVRCGQRYFLQVRSQSAGSWIMDHARVEAPQGETIPLVAAPKYRQHALTWDLNLIVVEIPPGTRLSLLKLHMVGKDGRVAQTTVEDLP